jgi:putative transposase
VRLGRLEPDAGKLARPVLRGGGSREAVSLPGVSHGKPKPKEIYAVQKRIAVSAQIQQQIDDLVTRGISDGGSLAEIGRLGARLALQRALEEEVSEFLGRARYEQTPEARGSRNGVRPRRVQTAEGELEVQVPQLRNTAEQFVSKVIPHVRQVMRTRPLEALVIGAYVRGLSDRDVESLLQEAGLGRVSRSTACRICRELRDRYQAFRARSLSDVELLVLFVDAIYLPTRPSGRKEGVLVAWGYDADGNRVLLDICLGQRERYEDWLEMGRGLARRGLRAPGLVVADGAPALMAAIGDLWPRLRGSGALCTSCVTSWPSSRSDPNCRSASEMPTGRPWTRRSRPRMANLAYACW